ncbi:MAG: hypothetical protein AAB784_01175 [Patescibacteria group bacterium]
MNKQKIILVIILAIVGSFVLFYGFSEQEVSEPEFSSSPVNTSTSIVEPSPTLSAKPFPTQTQRPDAMNKYPPAECALTGSIILMSPTLYENKDANIIYKNIDSIARHIIWTVSPNDNLSVGPNLFVNLPLPDGTEDVTINLPQNPKSKNYVLTAKVNYGVFVNRNLEIREAVCSGQIVVNSIY